MFNTDAQSNFTDVGDEIFKKEDEYSYLAQ